MAAKIGASKVSSATLVAIVCQDAASETAQNSPQQRDNINTIAIKRPIVTILFEIAHKSRWKTPYRSPAIFWCSGCNDCEATLDIPLPMGVCKSMKASCYF